MSGDGEDLHLAWGVSRADSVRSALRMQGCGARVVALSQALDLGPIETLDPASRCAWFEANTQRELDDRVDHGDPQEPWTEATATSVNPIYWVSLSDAGEHACFLEFASRMAGRSFDIVDVTGLDVMTALGALRVWSLGQLRPEEIVASRLLERRRSFSHAECEIAAATWSRLRRENAPVRVVRDGHLVSAPLTHYDAVLAAQASNDWDLLIRLIARTIDHLGSPPDGPGQGCDDEFLFARVLAMGEAGVLEVTGSGPGMRDYEVRRSAGRKATTPPAA